MRLLKSFFIVAIMCSLSACFMPKKKPYIEVLEGVFYTPRGSYEIEVVSEKERGEVWSLAKSRDAYLGPNVFLSSITSNDVEVGIGVLNQYAKLILDYKSKGKSYSFSENASYSYQNKSFNLYFRGSKDKPYTYVRDTIKREGGQFFYTLPPPLARYSTVLQGGGLTKSQLAVYEKYEDEPHRIIIPFKIGEDEYKFDVTFKVTTKTDWVGGVPGM